EIFEGAHYGSIFGTISVALIGGGAAGPWIAGLIHDATGSYRLAFMLTIACCVGSAAAIWVAAPGKVRLVPGRVRPQERKSMSSFRYRSKGCRRPLLARSGG